ncbi:MAG TPA: hypothetical protein ENK70_03545, partial [Methylophaga sp.]|nr:hypothetical protein [Methylophaga sp.]
MATDNILTRKGEAPVTYDTNRGGEIQADGGPYIGIIKHNEDPLRMGRVMVYINELSDADENDPTQWILLSYMSPFFGYTPHDLQTTKESKFDNNAHAYGMWFPPPDVDVSVMCIFPKGDFQTQGFYIGCIPEPQINHMVPGYGSAPADRVSYNNQQEQASYAGGSATALPVVEIPKSRSEMNNADFYKTAKPVNTVIAAQLDFQGLLGDNVRGPITTSSQRETPSYSYGISTPGRPILESGYHENTMRSAIEGGGTTDNDFNVTGRRSGHSFVMDDGDVDGNDVLMRLRTSSGHQFSLSDNGQCIYITHANGQTWMEFGNEGTIDLFSTNSINLRSHGDVNIHADQDINMYAKRNVNSFSGSHTKIEAGKTYTSLSKERTDIYSSQVINVKSDGTLAMHSSKLTSIFAENDEVDIKGEAIQLNSGSGSSIAKPASIQKISTADTYKSAIGWFSEEGLLRTITSRTPTHEPYSGHNAGVNIAVPQTLGTPAGAKVTNPPSPGIASVTSNASSPLPSSEQTSRADVIKRAKSSPSLQDIGNASKEEIAGTIAQVEKTLEETGTVFE